MQAGLPSCRRECLHTPYYCEENTWHLCSQLRSRSASLLARCAVVFISNANRTVPLWRQRVGPDDGAVVWDYHVFLLYRDNSCCLVFDLDATTNFPVQFGEYADQVLGGREMEEALEERFRRSFRVVDACQYLNNFSSDRSHMKAEDGTWLKQPPSTLPIFKGNNNLDDFISMEKSEFLGTVMDLEEFVKTFGTVGADSSDNNRPLSDPVGLNNTT